MRTTAPGLTRRHDEIVFSFDGRLVRGERGDTIASALVDKGVLDLREGPSGAYRGLFCGMGVCQECVVRADGKAVNACMTPIQASMEVMSSPWAGLSMAENPPQLQHVVHEPDVLVVGGGPAGLTTAAITAEAGASVLLIDERRKLGGQYFKQPADAFEVDELAIDSQYRKGRALIQRVLDSGVTFVGGAQVWAAASPKELLAVNDGQALTLRPKRLVIATGAYERGVPIPGWTLPGFFTTGAVQTLLRAYQVAPGARVLVSGNGPLNAQVAAELIRANVTVVALCETAAARSLSRLLAAARMAAAAPDLARLGIGYLKTIRTADVPLLFEHAVIRADGERRVEQATVARLDSQGVPVPETRQIFEVDAVCVGFGFLPSNELARTLGVEHTFNARLGQLEVVRSQTGRTSVEGVWVVGDSGGTGGARLAQNDGVIAAADVVRSLKRSLSPSLVREQRRALRMKRRNARFQAALQSLYAAPRLLDQLAEGDTPVCRCEEVSLRAIEDAFATGIRSIGALKRVTRAGMGRCQGRYCAPILSELSSRRSAVQPEESSWFAPAPPFKPITLSVVAAALRADETEQTVRDRSLGRSQAEEPRQAIP